jgi:hypothetical protein
MKIQIDSITAEIIDTSAIDVDECFTITYWKIVYTVKIWKDFALSTFSGELAYQGEIKDDFQEIVIKMIRNLYDGFENKLIFYPNQKEKND